MAFGLKEMKNDFMLTGFMSEQIFFLLFLHFALKEGSFKSLFVEDIMQSQVQLMRLYSLLWMIWFMAVSSTVYWVN
jgi:hypothetical protein